MPLDAITHYLTTDLDLYSADDLAALAAAFESRGFKLVRGVTRYPDEECFCGFSTGGEDYDEPEPQIAAILAAIEGLDPPLQSAWAGCSVRLFDLGYDCGEQPFSLRQDLSAETLARLAAAGATLRITLYSERRARPAEPGAVADGGT